MITSKRRKQVKDGVNCNGHLQEATRTSEKKGNSDGTFTRTVTLRCAKKGV